VIRADNLATDKIKTEMELVPTGTRKNPGEELVKDVKSATRKHYSSEETIRIALVSCGQSATWLQRALTGNA